MTTINIDASAIPVLLEMEFQTPQQFFYTVEVTDQEGNVKFTDQGRWDDKKKFDLGPGSALINRYLNIYWTVIDPNGAGNNFNATATIKQNNGIKPAIQICSGTSATTTVNKNTYAHFV